jgi:hypothetical protein
MSRTLLWRLVALALPLLTGLLGAFNGPEAFRTRRRPVSGSPQGLKQHTESLASPVRSASPRVARGLGYRLSHGQFCSALPEAWHRWSGVALGVSTGLLALLATAAIAAAAVWLGWRALEVRND